MTYICWVIGIAFVAFVAIGVWAAKDAYEKTWRDEG